MTFVFAIFKNNSTLESVSNYLQIYEENTTKIPVKHFDFNRCLKKKWISKTLLAQVEH